MGALDLGIGAIFYTHPEAAIIEDKIEGGLTVGTSVFDDLLYLQFSYFHDFEFGGNYFELAGRKTIPLTDCLDLNLGGGIGYGDDYEFQEDISIGDHVFASAGLTYWLTDAASINAYVAHYWLYDDSEDEENLHGGAALTVRF
ncbi:MAG: hypothetical protein ACI8UO_006563 [Verrucomicrobiales bacterium]|jgi:hypothetical protein